MIEVEGDRSRRAREAVAANPVWYHTIELAPGVVTPGRVDLREAAGRLLPADLGSRRALDVGTFDGFWAFELERRGAEVVAIDVETADAAEWPPLTRDRHQRTARELGVELGRGFRLAAEALDSSVRRVTCSVYELAPDAIGGPVDFVFSGAILVHLRDPVRALERIAAVLRPGGELLLVEPFSPRLTATSPWRPAASFQAAGPGMNWWVPNPAAIGAWLRAAGLEGEHRVRILRPPADPQMRQWQVAFRAFRPAG